MLFLLQTTPQADGIFIPVWMMGLFGTVFMLLLVIIGFFIKNMIGTFRGLVGELKEALGKAVEAFQAFKDEAPKEFVTYPFFELARQELKEGNTRAHKRISELREELVDHSRNCPAIRSLTEKRDRNES